MLLRNPRLVVLDFYEECSTRCSGHAVATELAHCLQASRRYSVLERSTWCRSSDVIELAAKYRNNLPWAVNTGAIAGADAVVMGSTSSESNRQRCMTASILDIATGNLLARVSSSTAKGLARLLTSQRILRRIHLGALSVRAQVTFIGHSSIVLTTGAGVELRPFDRLRVELILEFVADPCDVSAEFALVSAAVGEAEVLSVTSGTVSICYAGHLSLRIGDSVVLYEI